MQSINEYTNTLINAKRYEIMNESIFDRFRKNKQKLSSNNSLKKIQLTDNEKKKYNNTIDTIEQETKLALSKIKSSIEYKEKMKQTQENMIKCGFDKSEIHHPNVSVEEFDTYCNKYENKKDIYCELILSIIDDTQDIAIQYSWILHMLYDNIKLPLQNKGINNLSCGFGDGDEGCMYITFTI